MSFPSGTAVNDLPANAEDIGDVSSIPGLGGAPAAGNGNLLQYSYLGNPIDREGWWAHVHGAAKEVDTGD